MRPCLSLLSVALALAAPSLATAGEWKAVAGSNLRFIASYQGEDITGSFAMFSARIGFDPAAPGECRFEVRIALTDVVVDMDEAGPMLQEDDFFATGRHPEARWSAQGCRAESGGAYVADGELSLRGVTKPVPLRFTWTPGASPGLVGEATVPRLQFGVGGGEWADTGLIPDAVSVRTRLVLQAVE